MASINILRVCLLLVYLPYIAISANVPLSPGYCPLRGPIFPRPRELSNAPDFDSARNNISTSLNRTLDSAVSISLQIFDIDHASPLFQFTSTSEHINTTLGVNKVDEDTVFRLGSVSKLWTVLMILAEKGLDSFSDRIVHYVPEFFMPFIGNIFNQTKSDDHVDFVPWGDVTIGELASHLAGVARDCQCSPPDFS